MTGTPVDIVVQVDCETVSEVRVHLPDDREPPAIDATALADYVRGLDAQAVSRIVAERSGMGTSTAALYLDTIAQLIEADG